MNDRPKTYNDGLEAAALEAEHRIRLIKMYAISDEPMTLESVYEQFEEVATAIRAMKEQIDE